MLKILTVVNKMPSHLFCHYPVTFYLLFLGKLFVMKRIATIWLLLLFTIVSMAHPWKPSHYVIVDTDGGLDDMKALCMLLASPDVRVMAITVSQGFHSEEEAYGSVRSMLDAFHHEGVPVVRSGGACALIAQSLDDETTPVTFIALGTLRTAALALTTVPQFRKKIKQIIWSNSGLPSTEGFNYRLAPEAAVTVLSDTIPMLVTGAGGENFYDEITSKSIADVNTRLCTESDRNPERE